MCPPQELLNRLIDLDEILKGDDAIAGDLDTTVDPIASTTLKSSMFSYAVYALPATFSLAQQWVGIV
jgi:hypothetical protein